MNTIKVMLFDDNSKILDSMCMLLDTHEGFDVCGAYSNVLNCLEEVKIKNPDIVLMDVDILVYFKSCHGFKLFLGTHLFCIIL